MDPSGSAARAPAVRTPPPEGFAFHVLEVDGICIGARDTLREARRRLRESGGPALLVSADDGTLVGVLSRSDVRAATIAGLSGEEAVIMALRDDPVCAGVGSSSQTLQMLLDRVPLVPMVDGERRILSAVARKDGRERLNIESSTVCVLGLGYVGLTLAAVMADIGFRVVGVDRDAALVEQLHRGRPHFHEKGLEELLAVLKQRELPPRWTSQMTAPCADIYVITVGTPILRPQLEPNLDYVRAAAREVGAVLMPGNLVILRSTVPVGVTRSVVLPTLEEVSGLSAGRDFSLAFCPERTIEGKALRELRELPQIVGGLDRLSAELAAQLFRTNTGAIIDVGSLEAAEMVKILDNTYRDVSFAYANQMALLCEALGLDMVSLVRAANTGYNRNNIPVPSPGVGGACLSKDPYILASVCRTAGVDPGIFLLGRRINEEMPRHVVRRTAASLSAAGKDIENALVLVLGFAFKGKPETSDLRDSPTVDLVATLKGAGARVRGFDPVVPLDEIAALGVEPVTLEDGFEGIDAVIIMLNHPLFEDMDIVSLLERANRPVTVLDGWHLFDADDFVTLPGVTYGCIGS